MDKEELKLKNNEKLEEATDKMKEITNENPDHFKTKRLGSSMGNYVTQLERDVRGHRRRNPVFKHGTLVYVDFGINYGSEFSSYHYAITLAKNDTRKSNTITVVPLTSKIGKQNLKLNSSISGELALCTIDNTIERNNLILEVSEKSLDMVEDLIERYKQAEETKNSEELDDIRELLNEFNSLSQKIAPLKKTVDDAKKRLDKYMEDLDKNTYIKIDAITTIDKNKIFKPKDDLDPLTRVRVSGEVLELIEEGIKNLFFKSN